MIWRRTDRRGRFRIKVRPGSHAVAVSHPWCTGPEVCRVSVDAGSTCALPFPLRLRRGEAWVQGEIRDGEGRPVHGLLGLLPPLQDPRLNATSVRLAPILSGRYRIAVPPGTYFFFPWAKGWFLPGRWVDVGPGTRIQDAVLLPEPVKAGRATLRWLRARAVNLDPAEPGSLEPLAGALRPGTVLALGEMTHGSDEFRQLLHRVVQQWAARGETGAIALEMPIANGFPVDAYVQGRGPEPREALPLAYRTGEIREFLRWLRRFNEGRGPRSRFRIHGIDMADPGSAYRHAAAFYRRHDPDAAAILHKDLADLGGAGELTFPGDAARARRWRAALERLRRRLDAPGSPPAANPRTLADQHRVLVALEQFIPLALDRTQGSRAREQAMAENVRWVLGEDGPGGRVLLFAHGGHVARTLRDPMGWPTLGWHLGKELGEAYIPVGLTFHRGGFLALESSRAHPAWLPFEVGPEARATLNEALASLHRPCLLLDLRTAPADPWLRSPQGLRSIPLDFDPAAPELYLLPAFAKEEWDALLQLERITPSTPWP
ncbi:erythromycin esterase family protein [Mesoterricola silvestris]|uniref:erythromycin esterase family protein n=1 Tax=Mesoterricola silvestris TaxID=2927979 RepID=UPI00292E464E|nr:erythromycin esterase family protein [Mesoterricola silvestris]